MNPCLQTYDILECICDHLLATSSLSTLVALARTCRAFAEPALDALWRTIPSIEPLIQCLPEDAWRITPLRYLTLTRKTTSADWERCNFYAHRVRHFGWEEFDLASPTKLKASIPTDRQIFIALKPSSHDGKSSSVLTFPKLRSCRLEQQSSAPIPHFAPFLVSTLRSLELTAPPYDPGGVLPGILRSVAQASPLLRSLKIDGVCVVPRLESAFADGDGNEGLGLGLALSRMLKGLGQLDSLICASIRFPDDAVRYLAIGLRIRALHVKNTAEEILEALTPAREPCFSYLERLGVECGGDLAECIRLLGRVDAFEISSLEIGRNIGRPTEHELCEFFHVLAQKVNTRSMKTLIVRQNPCVGFVPFSQRPVPASKKTVALSTLSPLLAFTNLAEFHLLFDMDFALDDQDAEYMARAWRHLNTLQLGFPDAGWGRVGGRVMTLDGLGAFARWCPELKSLGVCVNGVSTSAQKGVRCPSLRFLHVGDSEYEDAVCVAKYLADVFPGLEGVHGPGWGEWQKKWREVHDILRNTHV